MIKTYFIPQAIVGRITALYLTDEPDILEKVHDGNRVGIGAFRTWLAPAGEDEYQFHIIAELSPEDRSSQ